jgi:hypothetical protein
MWDRRTLDFLGIGGLTASLLSSIGFGSLFDPKASQASRIPGVAPVPVLAALAITGCVLAADRSWLDLSSFEVGERFVIGLGFALVFGVAMWWVVLVLAQFVRAIVGTFGIERDHAEAEQIEQKIILALLIAMFGIGLGLMAVKRVPDDQVVWADRFRSNGTTLGIGVLTDLTGYRKGEIAISDRGHLNGIWLTHGDDWIRLVAAWTSARASQPGPWHTIGEVRESDGPERLRSRLRISAGPDIRFEISSAKGQTVIFDLDRQSESRFDAALWRARARADRPRDLE